MYVCVVAEHIYIYTCLYTNPILKYFSGEGNLGPRYGTQSEAFSVMRDASHGLCTGFPLVVCLGWFARCRNLH